MRTTVLDKRLKNSRGARNAETESIINKVLVEGRVMRTKHTAGSLGVHDEVERQAPIARQTRYLR